MCPPTFQERAGRVAPVCRPVLPCALKHWPPSLDKADQHDDDRHHQENVDEPGDCVRRDHSE